MMMVSTNSVLCELFSLLFMIHSSLKKIAHRQRHSEECLKSILSAADSNDFRK